MSKLNRNTENQEHASHLPEHGPIDENGKEVLLSLKNVDITFGKGDNAVRAFKKIAPDGENNPSMKTTAEPYVFTNCYLKHPSVDMMVGFSWQTGSSAWGLMCYYEGILGLRRGYDGLHINPALPKEWKNAEAYRNYRGNRLHVKYKNSGGKNVVLTVDGKKIKGNVVPLFNGDNEHTVVVELK